MYAIRSYYAASLAELLPGGQREAVVEQLRDRVTIHGGNGRQRGGGVDRIVTRLVRYRDGFQPDQPRRCIATERVRLGCPVEEAGPAGKRLEAVLARLVVVEHRQQTGRWSRLARIHTRLVHSERRAGIRITSYNVCYTKLLRELEFLNI